LQSLSRVSLKRWNDFEQLEELVMGEHTARRIGSDE